MNFIVGRTYILLEGISEETLRDTLYDPNWRSLLNAGGEPVGTIKIGGAVEDAEKVF